MKKKKTDTNISQYMLIKILLNQSIIFVLFGLYYYANVVFVIH